VRGFNRVAAGVALGMATLALAAPGATASVPHTVQTGETLSYIAAVNGLTTDSVAAFNGISPDSYVYSGETIQIPSEGEGATSSATSTSAATGTAASHTVAAGETLSGIAAANGVTTDALASANGISSTSWVSAGQVLSVPVATTSTAVSSTGVSLGAIYCPCGTDYLRSDAAAAWNEMRSAARSTYGVDIYPNGPISAYRTYDQQASLYNDYLSGVGAPANPPGTSAHELGTSVDVATPEMRSIVDALGPAYGWGKVHAPGEWWHVDYLG
jgi:LysM repeat protein